MSRLQEYSDDSPSSILFFFLDFICWEDQQEMKTLGDGMYQNQLAPPIVIKLFIYDICVWLCP